MRELSAMEMKEEVLLTIRQLLLPGQLLLYFSTLGEDREKASREYTLQFKRGCRRFNKAFSNQWTL